MSPAQDPWPVDPDVQGATDEAIAVFKSMGAYIDYVELPLDLPELYRHWGTIVGAEAYHLHVAYIEDASLPFHAGVRARVIAGKAVTGSAYVAAPEHRKQEIGRASGRERVCHYVEIWVVAVT